MIGQSVSHYHITDRLGQGGMGVVYKALDTKLDRSVALKFLSTSALPTDDDKARFHREAKAAAKLNPLIGETDSPHSHAHTVVKERDAKASSIFAAHPPIFGIGFERTSRTPRMQPTQSASVLSVWPCFSVPQKLLLSEVAPYALGG